MNPIIKPVIVGDIYTNCYLVADPESKEGVVIDPGADFDKIWKNIEKYGIIVKKIVATHGHYDHLGAVNELRKKTKAVFLIHKEDVIFAEHPETNGSALFGDGTVSAKADAFLKEGDVVKTGKVELKVIHTPGHSPGGICLYTEGELFSGDTLFLNSIGGTDFPNASYKLIMDSLAKLMKLPEATRVYPGHGQYTTIGEEKKNNPFLNNN
ncbi:MAG: MBL fold metallo-hydrolase [Candidatus Firestonebacteria bacterium]|nr:MBL fold metallo-hydrolase [Candidatus Firestonebacteria bacterium]